MSMHASSTTQQSFWQQTSQYFCGGAFASYVAFRIINTAFEKGIDICPYLPESVYQFAYKVCRVREYLPQLPGTIEQETLMVPMIEETLFRIGLQELLLRQLPKAIIKRVAPSHLSKVDSRAATLARVLLTSTAFAFAHAVRPAFGWPNCSVARMVQTFAVGLILGTIQETTHSPQMAMTFHAGYNFAGAYLRNALGISFQCAL